MSHYRYVMEAKGIETAHDSVGLWFWPNQNGMHSLSD
jgi:hypothetical protein